MSSGVKKYKIDLKNLWNIACESDDFCQIRKLFYVDCMRERSE